MRNIMPQAPSVAERARVCPCPLCWQRPGYSCTISGPPGDHLSRYRAAERAGQVSREQLAEVLGGLVVVAEDVIVPEQRERAS
jgi:hypothetical protein